MISKLYKLLLVNKSKIKIIKLHIFNSLFGFIKTIISWIASVKNWRELSKKKYKILN